MSTKPDISEALAIRKTWQDDPLAFCTAMGWPTWADAIAEHGLDCDDKQGAILEALAGYGRRTVWVRSGNGVGKTYIASIAATWFLYAFAPCIVLTTAPTDRQVKHLLWGEIRKRFNDSKQPLGGELLLQQWHSGMPEWYALGFTSKPNDPNRFQGFHSENILVIVDEANGIAQDVWDGIRGILTTPNAKLLAIGNPHVPEGGFYDAFQKDRGNCICIDASKNPNVLAGRVVIPGLTTRESIDEWIEDYGKDNPVVQSRVYGNFPSDSPDQLIPTAWIQAAVDRTLERSGDREIGIDVARSGEDETVLADRQGDVVGALRCYRSGSEPLRGYQVADYAIAFGKEIGATRYKVDAIGVGVGPVDTLHERGYTVFEIVVSEQSSNPERFPNKRCEEWWKLRKRFEEGRIDIPDDSKLFAQLASIRWKPDNRGRVVIEKKQDAKARGLKSPDRAEGVLMAFASVDDVAGFDFGGLIG